MASEPPGEDDALPARRRDYYGTVWKAAKKRTRERLFESSASAMRSHLVNGGITLVLTWTAGTNALGIPSDGAVEKAILATGAVGVYLFGRRVVVLGDELFGAPVTMWKEAQEEQRRITADRDEIQLARTNETTALQRRIDDLLTPGFRFFVDDPNKPPFLDDDPFNRDQTIVRVGLRTRGVKSVQNVEVRLVRAIPSDNDVPSLQIDPEAILEIRGGTQPWGRDLNNGQDIHPQLLIVRSNADGPLPEVKVHYANPNLAAAYPVLPCGEWLLTLQATGGNDVAPARRHFTLRVTDDPDRRKRAVLRVEPDEEDD